MRVSGLCLFIFEAVNSLSYFLLHSSDQKDNATELFIFMWTFIDNVFLYRVFFLGAYHHPVHWLSWPHLFVLLCVPGREGCGGWGGEDRLLQLCWCPVVGRGKTANLERIISCKSLSLRFWCMSLQGWDPWAPKFPILAYIPKRLHHMQVKQTCNEQPRRCIHKRGWEKWKWLYGRPDRIG